MGTFEEHVRYGVAVHLVLSTGTVAAAVLGAPLAVVAGVVIGAPVTIVGACVPDIDHHRSKPYRVLKRWSPSIAAGTVALVLGVNRALLIDLCALVTIGVSPAFLAGALYATVVAGTYRGVARAIPVLRPVHRTVTHSPLVGIAIGGFLAAVATTVGVALSIPRALDVAMVVGACFVTGFGSHLVLDGELGVRKWVRNRG